MQEAHRTIWILGALASVTACAALSRLRFEQPSFALEAVEITGLGLRGGSFTLWLDVFNPNDYELRTTRMEAELDLEDVHFGSTVLEKAVSFPSAEHTRVGVPVSFTWEGVGAAARALLERGSVAYDLETRFWLDSSLGSRRIVLRRTGDVPITDTFP